MKKSCILIAVLFSSFVFCTKDSSTQVSTNSGYTDSIIVDLFSYKYFAEQNYPAYYTSITIMPLGQPFLKTLDPMLVKPLGDSQHIVIMPKYNPIKFEAWLYDSIPLLPTDSTDPNLLVKEYTFSSNYFWRKDTSSNSADLIANLPNNCQMVMPVNLTYYNGYGFEITDMIYWGIGKIKIYYK